MANSGEKLIDFTPPAKQRRMGTLFLEARLKEGTLAGPQPLDCEQYERTLQAKLASLDNTFDMLENIIEDERNGKMKLGAEFAFAKQTLDSLKVVEYIGPVRKETCFSLRDVKLKVQVFELYTEASPLGGAGDGHEQLGEVVAMPHARFEAVWDELVFDHDIKADLIWMMTNILRFSQAFRASDIRRKLNPMILLYGPPGTGKTRLCQGLAQKISIRLSGQYEFTTLIQVKTAILLSKYFSESARHVDEIFNKISQMCQEEPNRFVCVLIDEVESIASSRRYSTQEGESHDALRATNALLTGLDRMAGYSNLVFLFTSNMCDALDSAFLDRCGLKEYVGPPSVAAQYEILRGILQKLASCQVIDSDAEIPSYDDARFQAIANPENASFTLLDIVRLIQRTNDAQHTEISGRGLAQLPEKALMRYLRDEDCDLDTALRFMAKSVLDGSGNGMKPEDATRGKAEKRTWAVFLEDECGLDIPEFLRAL